MFMDSHFLDRTPQLTRTQASAFYLLSLSPIGARRDPPWQAPRRAPQYHAMDGDFGQIRQRPWRIRRRPWQIRREVGLLLLFLDLQARVPMISPSHLTQLRWA